MNAFFGLDFGTTNSALSVNENGNVHLIDIDEFNLAEKTMRSILFFNENNDIFIGQNAINEYLKNGANGRLMQSIKTSLPHKNFTHTNIFGKLFGLEDLIAIILRHIKETGEKNAGREINDVILGRPVVFSENAHEDKIAETRLETAAKNAGFKNIRFQLEPVAAALSFEKTLASGKEKIIFVGDFGGGTSDFTIMKLTGETEKTKETRKNDILSTGGVSIGGDIFDSNIMWEKIAKYFGKEARYKSVSGSMLNLSYFITRTLCKWHLISSLQSEETYLYLKQVEFTTDDKTAIKNLLSLIKNNYGLMVFQAIEEAKHELSIYDKSSVNYKNKDFEIKEDITKIEFENIINEEIKKIEKCARETLSKSGLTENKIDFVFLTGGTSKIPAVKNIFAEKFGPEKIKETDAFTSVAYGLGFSGYLF